MQPPEPTPGRVLIVDDDADILRAVDEVLRDVGYETTACASATEALDVLETTNIDVVVTDIRMPSVDGIELCARVVRNYNVPVVVMTAFGETQAAVNALRAEAVDFITKPFSVAAVTEAVARALDRGRDRSRIKKLSPSADADSDEVAERAAEAASLDDLQREHMEKVLRAVGGNKAEAARVLGIDRATLYRRMKRFGWDRAV